MGVDKIVYSISRNDNIPIVYSNRANAPERVVYLLPKQFLKKIKKI